MHVENQYDREDDLKQRLEKALLVNEQRLDELADRTAELATAEFLLKQAEQRYRENLSHALIGAVIAEEKQEKAEQDAARYRWLRDVAHPDSDTGVCAASWECSDWGKHYFKHHHGARLDDVIDQQLAKPRDAAEIIADALVASDPGCYPNVVSKPINVDGLIVTDDVMLIGEACWDQISGNYRCLANVNGALCVVEVKLTPEHKKCTTCGGGGYVSQFDVGGGIEAIDCPQCNQGDNVDG